MNAAYSRYTDTVKNQTQGGSVFGITTAISDGITFDKGRVQQSNFHNYRVPRMSDSPLEVEVEVIEIIVTRITICSHSSWVIANSKVFKL